MPTRGPVIADEVIRLTGLHAADRCTVPLRQVTIWDDTQQRTRTFLPNILHIVRPVDQARYGSQDPFPVGLDHAVKRLTVPAPGLLDEFEFD